MLKSVWCQVFGHAKPITYKVRQGGFYIGPDGQGLTDSIQWECPRCGGQAHAISLHTLSAFGSAELQLAKVVEYERTFDGYFVWLLQYNIASN